MNKYDRRHIRDISRYEQQITALFSAAATDAANIAPWIGTLGDVAFSWSDYPLALAQIRKIIKQLNDDITAAIVNGIRSQWTLSNNKNDELCQQVFGSLAYSLPEATARRYYSTNESARDAFIVRKVEGLNLSDRVWNYTNQFKEEIEMALDLGVRSGLSADEISRDVRGYLNYPDKLFRRVRDEHGQLQLSKHAAAFHPGRGVYRSSYMNARRLAATETNIAYRTADHLRWQQLDFVVGIEIHLSNNHNCKGVPAGMFFDICDELQGKYPKDFQFTGWHPHCRCYATTILKTEQEMAADNARIMAGEDIEEGSENEVTALPSNFTGWLENNGERIARAKSTPYFLRDNQKVIDGNAERLALQEERRAMQERLSKLAFKDNSERTMNAVAAPYNEAMQRDYELSMAFLDYTSGSTEINDVARFGRLLTKSWDSNNVEDWKSVISNMDRAIEKLPRLSRNIDMFRSSYTIGDVPISGKSLAELNSLAGQKFTDKGFTSFSLSRDVAVELNEELDVTIVLNAKKGTKGVALGDVSAFNTMERQEEYLLARGTTLEVIGAKEVDGRKYLFVRIAK